MIVVLALAMALAGLFVMILAVMMAFFYPPAGLLVLLLLSVAFWRLRRAGVLLRELPPDFSRTSRRS